MITEEMKKLIEEHPLAFATVDSEGNPHCIAVAFVKVVAENQILVTENYMKETSENIAKNPNVALVVWNKDWQKNCCGYELKGTAQRFTEGEWFDKVKNMPENEGEPCKAAILIKIKKIKKLA